MAAAVALSPRFHYLASAGYFLGGLLSTVAHLWLLFDFLSVLGLPRKLKYLHQSLAVANLILVAVFLFGTLSHFEQKWYFGNFWCQFYIFIAMFSTIAAVGNLAAVLYAEYTRAFNPKLDPDAVVHFKLPLALAWTNALFWGLAAIGGWAETGIEPAGYTCTVLWYNPSSYVNGLTFVGFGGPIAISTYIAIELWRTGKTKNALTAVCARLVVTTWIQFAGFTLAYVWILLTGKSIPLYIMALIPVSTKMAGLLHPLVYGRTLHQNQAVRKTK